MEPSLSPLNRIIRIAWSIAGLILVGALGSGLWDLFLKDAFLELGNLTLTFIVSLWGGYVDVLHRSIGKLHHDLLIVPLFALFIVAGLLIPWAMIWKLLSMISQLRERIFLRLREESNSQFSLTEKDIPLTEEVQHLRTRTILFLVPFSVSITLLVAIMAWQLTYTRSASTWAEQSIEILAPYVTQQEHLKLRSDLRRVDNAEKFYFLHGTLRATANRNAVPLPSFMPIGERSDA